MHGEDENLLGCVSWRGSLKNFYVFRKTNYYIPNKKGGKDQNLTTNIKRRKSFFIIFLTIVILTVKN